MIAVQVVGVMKKIAQAGFLFFFLFFFFSQLFRRSISTFQEKQKQTKKQNSCQSVDSVWKKVPACASWIQNYFVT